MAKLSPYLIEPILPKYEVHLLAGVTGVGKTTWLFHTLIQEWSHGEYVLGFPSYPVPWVYVAADRSLASAYRTMDAMGIDHSTIDIIPAHGADHKSFNQVMEAVAEKNAELVVVEAFGSFVDDPARSKQVSAFIHSSCAWTPPSKDFPNGLTILGVVESPKMKPAERYKLPRQRISGVATWGHMADCIMLIEHTNPGVQGDPNRVLYVCPRIGKDMEFHGSFNDQNHLVFDGGSEP
jgi:hypothetical protein